MGHDVRALPQSLSERHESPVVCHHLHRRRTGNNVALSVSLAGGLHSVAVQISAARHFVFWLFLGGFCWVIGDLFQQYATKYIGIGRGIPLSNTNQLWGLAWGALVFGELAGLDRSHQLVIVAGSAVMILGALAISTAAASAEEHHSTSQALLRECNRYNLDYHRALMAQAGMEHENQANSRKRWWDYLIVAIAIALFVWFARGQHASAGHESELGRGIVPGSRSPAPRKRTGLCGSGRDFSSEGAGLPCDLAGKNSAKRSS